MLVTGKVALTVLKKVEDNDPDMAFCYCSRIGSGTG